MVRWVIGIDEVGRGPLAGPVSVCASAIEMKIYKKIRWRGLTDSKAMTERAREKWYHEAVRLENAGKIKFVVRQRHAQQIDEKGINRCIRECVASALGKLGLDPKQTLVLLDGGLFAPAVYIRQRTIIAGDRSQKIISLSSVIAKVTRDRYMKKAHQQYPLYAWFENKGYGTKFHTRSILKNGTSSLHRKTFCKKLLRS